MTAQRAKYYRAIFLAATLYDVVLGLLFVFFYRHAFQWLGAQLPYSGAFITLLGASAFVIGIAYFLVFLGDLQRNRDLIVIGTLYKAAYSGVSFYHLASGDIPHILFAALFGIIDVAFLVLFPECLFTLRRSRSRR